MLRLFEGLNAFIILWMTCERNFLSSFAEEVQLPNYYSDYAILY